MDGEIETSVHAVKYKGKKPDFTRRVETVNNVNFVKRTTTCASIGLMEKNAASVTWRTILLRCAEVEIKNLKGEHRNLWRAFPRNLRGVFIELKKPNQQSLMMKFTACIQSLTAAVLNTWFNLSWEGDGQVIRLRWPCRLIADQRLIAWKWKIL